MWPARGTIPGGLCRVFGSGTNLVEESGLKWSFVVRQGETGAPLAWSGSFSLAWPRSSSNELSIRVRWLVAGIAAAVVDRAGVAVLIRFGVLVSRTRAPQALMALLESDRPVPAVLGVDDFALPGRRRCATLLIDEVAHARVDVLPDRKATTLATWLREHSRVQAVYRDGSAACTSASRQGLGLLECSGDRQGQSMIGIAILRPWVQVVPVKSPRAWP